MVCISKDTPYIHAFKTSESYYVYDVNTTKILTIPESVYNYLSNPNASEADEATELFIQDMKANGFLRTDRVVTPEHPSTHLLPYYLKNKMGHLILQVTQGCNLRCNYCAYSGLYNNRSHAEGFMSDELMERSVDFFIKRSKDSKRVTVSFYGGEPMMNIDLIKRCVRYIKARYSEKEIGYAMTTNGTLLDDDSISFFAENDFRLLISIDGPQMIHDANRRFVNTGEGSFSKIIENVERIKHHFPEYYDEYVRFNTVMDTEYGFGCYSEFIFGEEILGADKFTLSNITDNYINTKADASDEFIAERNYEFFKLLLSKLGEISKERTSRLINSQFVEIYRRCFQSVEIVQERIPLKSHHSGPCIPGAMRLFIDITGRLFPCERVSELSNTVLLGDIENGISIDKASQILNIEKTTHSRCSECWAYQQCFVCVAMIDDTRNVSEYELDKRCPIVCNLVDGVFKDYCVLREFGYGFEEEKASGGVR